MKLLNFFSKDKQDSWFKPRRLFIIIGLILALSHFISAMEQYKTTHTFKIYYYEGYYEVSYGRNDFVVPEKINVEVWQNGELVNAIDYYQSTE